MKLTSIGNLQGTGKKTKVEICYVCLYFQSHWIILRFNDEDFVGVKTPLSSLKMTSPLK